MAGESKTNHTRFGLLRDPTRPANTDSDPLLGGKATDGALDRPFKWKKAIKAVLVSSGAPSLPLKKLRKGVIAHGHNQGISFPDKKLCKKAFKAEVRPFSMSSMRRRSFAVYNVETGSLCLVFLGSLPRVRLKDESSALPRRQ